MPAANARDSNKRGGKPTLFLGGLNGAAPEINIADSWFVTNRGNGPLISTEQHNGKPSRLVSIKRVAFVGNNNKPNRECSPTSASCGLHLELFSWTGGNANYLGVYACSLEDFEDAEATDCDIIWQVRGDLSN